MLGAIHELVQSTDSEVESAGVAAGTGGVRRIRVALPIQIAESARRADATRRM